MPIALARLKSPRPLVPCGFGMRVGVAASMIWAAQAAARATCNSFSAAFRASIQLDQKSISRVKGQVYTHGTHCSFDRALSPLHPWHLQVQVAVSWSCLWPGFLSIDGHHCSSLPL